MGRRKLPQKDWKVATFRFERDEYEDFMDYCYARGESANAMIVKMVRGKINRKNRAA